MWFKNALKGQKLLAQGIALGMMAISKTPCKGKSFMVQWFHAVQKISHLLPRTRR